MKKEKLSEYLEILEMMHMQFGDSCHVALYDLEELPGKIVGLYGNLTNEVLDDAAPEYVVDLLKAEGNEVKNRFGFINKHMNGHVLRTSLHFIREDGRVIGCFCVNHNIVQIKMIISFLEELSQSNNPADGDEESIGLRRNESITEKPHNLDTVQDFVEETIEKFLYERLGLRNFPSLDKSEKLILIKELDQKGIFSVKGSVSMLANLINVSKFSIYSYLEEIRTAK